MLPLLLALTLAWGALAFGSVYPWAYQPLAVASGAIGLASLVHRRGDARRRINRSLAVGLTLVAAAVALQLVPLPRSVIEVFSPGTLALVARLYPVGGAAPSVAAAEWLPLSTHPPDTVTALALFLAFGCLFVGTARGLSSRDARTLVGALAALGVTLSLFALVQRDSPSGLLYGFWMPESGPRPGHRGGPFLNRNHFAGWLLMTTPLALGGLIGYVQRGVHEAGPLARERLLYFTSRRGVPAVLLAAAVPVMALALVHTLSRTAVILFVVTLLGFGVMLFRSRVHGRRSLMPLAYLVLLACVAVSRTGLDPLAQHFEAFAPSYAARLAAWKDTWQIFMDLPLAGCGVGAYAQAMLLYQVSSTDASFTYAHNDYVQLLAEGGLMVVVPVALFLVLFARQVRARFRHDTPDSITYWIRTGAMTGLLALAGQESVDFSLHMPANMAMLAAVMALAVGRLPHRKGYVVEGKRRDDSAAGAHEAGAHPVSAVS